MMPATPGQHLTRERFEAVISLAAPVLDFVLATGERLSRLTGDDQDYYPVRSSGEALPLSPGPSRPGGPPPGDAPAE
jgi:hypothetical protein